jgi:transcription antitermination factor NusG
MEELFGEVMVPTEEVVRSVAASVAKANVNSSRAIAGPDGDERRELALVRSVPRVMGFIGGI